MTTFTRYRVSRIAQIATHESTVRTKKKAASKETAFRYLCFAES